MLLAACTERPVTALLVRRGEHKATAAAPFYSAVEFLNGNRGVAVFPNAQDQPASIGEPTVCVFVARAIARQFRGPVAAVRAGAVSVLGAAVPEAPVDVDGDLRRPKTRSARRRSPGSGARSTR